MAQHISMQDASMQLKKENRTFRIGVHTHASSFPCQKTQPQSSLKLSHEHMILCPERMVLYTQQQAYPSTAQQLG
jgi:hypothetical protein